MTPSSLLVIDGKSVPSNTNEVFDVLNPFSGRVATQAASASSEDCTAAIESAGRALESWERTPIPRKREILLKAAEILDTDAWKTKCRQAVSEETAAAPYWAAFDVTAGGALLKSTSGLLSEIKGEVFPSSVIPGATIVAQRRAKGVMYIPFSSTPWITY